MNSSSSTMNEEPDALSVVNQLRDLAADPLNRRAIVQDQGCLPGLILFMDHPNPPVVHSALLALRYLAECRANREKMKGELGMMLSLQSVIQKTTTPGETKLLASEIYEILQSSNMADGDSVNEMNSRRRKAQFFLGTTNKRAKTVVLHIDGLDDTLFYPFLKIRWASMVAQWLRILLPMQATRVRALVQEDPTCHGATKPVHHNY
ncbi:armadillo repeat-containing protein 1 isoform X1 [Physeter macrocephalus]|uniref:Armadillo repeat-containing protein 1 n=1 Tax=Physeter macrocephalus TaxID=9755 RepID=A0A9W2X6U9_PHYMC|nr:armadillo repeat-containing protein 1 isoform X1 [Physeter catodon]